MTRTSLVVVTGAAAAAVFVWAADVRHSDASSPGPAAPSFTEWVDRVRSGVVQVQASCSGYDKSGTGFLVGPQLVATVLHVVNGADTVSLEQDGARIATGAVVGRDFQNDLALVRTDRPLTGYVFTLADRSAAPGRPVGSVGFPRGEDLLTAASGSVIAGGQAADLDGIERSGLIEIAMALDHGDSGAPVFALDDGEVIGLVDAGPNQPNGVGFAVDARVARPLVAQWAAAPRPLAGASC